MKIDHDCYLNGFYKDGSNYNECRQTCSNDLSCNGFAIAKDAFQYEDEYANRCYVYGAFGTSVRSGWGNVQHPNFVPSDTKSSGDQNVRCFRRNEIIGTMKKSNKNFLSLKLKFAM